MYHSPRCPHSLREEFYEKLNRYADAGWWKASTAIQAAPVLCIPKRDGRLRTVVDCRQRNDNTVKDVTPLPDQDIIREDVARAKYRSKIDLTDAYEQVRVRPEDVWKTAFSTIAGTYVSNVIQIGDCNAPATFQRLMTHIFQDVIGRFLHVYLDDMFIYSDTIEEHEQYLKIIFDRLRQHQLYLKWKKCELYSPKIDCLGHIIDDQGIHPDEDKLARIREWRTPRNYNDIQRFVGLVNYVANFLPSVSMYTGPLMGMTANGAPFHWRPIHQRCFDMIKHLCCKTLIIQPIQPKNDEPIWVICDASKSGVGAMYGQGPSWNNCRPAGFMSKKFTPAQMNYAVHELETLAILEALLKWEDKLVGYKLHVITDHKALEFFKTQNTLTNRQRRWLDYLAKFEFDITYIKGELNKVADCLSRYYENDTPDDQHEPHEFVNADVRIDRSGEDLPEPRYKELFIEDEQLRAMELRRSKRIQEKIEEREREAHELRGKTVPPSEHEDSKGHRRKEDLTRGDDITLAEALLGRANSQPHPSRDDKEFVSRVQLRYVDDPLFKLVLEEPKNYRHFTVTDGLIFTKNQNNDEVLCLPSSDRTTITQVINQGHAIVGHFGEQKTSEYLRRWYWWPKMGKEIDLWCKSCATCQQTKTSNKKPSGKLHSLPIPTKPWDSIGMDFIGPFPESKGYNYLWTDGQTERANRSIGQIFRSTVSHDQKNWVDCMDMTEFAINASISETMKYAPFELNGGYMPSMIQEIRGKRIPKGKVCKARPETSTYELDLPPMLKRRNIFPTFHISLLKPYAASSDALFPNRATPEPYDFGADEEQEWYVDEIIGHRRDSRGKLEYQIRWSLGDTTWEPHEECKKLEALDRYLELHNVRTPSKLPKTPEGVILRD
ncbi:hypothetical protein NLJ89_g8798 [Agrocybe chaxingu]|uniref:Reverse transcriptase domain-containing protein n=1 Tax=Agrocybe chaxingu TaxID=84603 RepID=A0A9W8MRU2_9AGAR|nr:hypothetical protein NLJ89_g8798 [Agrocybe chaxingu]